MRNFFAFSLFLMVLTGCATHASGEKYSGIVPSNQEGFGTLVFYRPEYPAFISTGDTVQINLDSGDIIKLDLDGYSHVELSAGSHQFTLDNKTFEVEVIEGEISYVEYHKRNVIRSTESDAVLNNLGLIGGIIKIASADYDNPAEAEGLRIVSQNYAKRGLKRCYYQAPEKTEI